MRGTRVYGSIIFSSHGRILIVQGRETGKWSFPKGHKSTPHEQPLDCAQRETWEETGISLGKNYLEVLQLAAGKYFIYKLEDEPMLKTHDEAEIMDMRWVDLDNLDGFNNNCDIRSYIMRGHLARHKEELCRQSLMRRKDVSFEKRPIKTDPKEDTIVDDPVRNLMDSFSTMNLVVIQ
jgi:8-oxo-dGTP pyrophosphatase MutT (NUDIX family)